MALEVWANIAAQLRFQFGVTKCYPSEILTIISFSFNLSTCLIRLTFVYPDLTNTQGTTYFMLQMFQMDTLEKHENSDIFYFHRTKTIQKQPPEVFCKKRCLKNFAKLTGKHLCQSLFFNKVAGVTYNFVEKETVAQVHTCFPVNFAKFLRTPFLQNTSGRLFLTMIRNFLHPNICWSLARSYQ